MISFLTREQTWLQPSKKNCSSLFFTAKHVFFISFQVNRIQNWSHHECFVVHHLVACLVVSRLACRILLCWLVRLFVTFRSLRGSYQRPHWDINERSDASPWSRKAHGWRQSRMVVETWREQGSYLLFMMQANIVSCQSFRVYMQMFECCFT